MMINKKYIKILMTKKQMFSIINNIIFFKKITYNEENLNLNFDFNKKKMFYNTIDKDYDLYIETFVKIIEQNIKIDKISFKLNNEIIKFLKLIKNEEQFLIKLEFISDKINNFVIIYNNQKSQSSFAILETDLIENNIYHQKFSQQIKINKKILIKIIKKFKKIISDKIYFFINKNIIKVYKFNETELQFLTIDQKKQYENPIVFSLNNSNLDTINYYITQINPIQEDIILNFDHNKNLILYNKYDFVNLYIKINNQNDEIPDLNKIISQFNFNYYIKLNTKQITQIIKRSLQISSNRNIAKYGINIIIENKIIEIQSIGNFNKNIEKQEILEQNFLNNKNNNFNINKKITINSQIIYQYLNLIKNETFSILINLNDKESPILLEEIQEDNTSKIKFSKIIMLFSESILI
jgi:hypothetical protein